MILEVYGRVSISCEAKREWHQPRANGKRRRQWLGMFIEGGPSDEFEWMTLRIPSARLYSQYDANGARWTSPAITWDDVDPGEHVPDLTMPDYLEDLDLSTASEPEIYDEWAEDQREIGDYGPAGDPPEFDDFLQEDPRLPRVSTGSTGAKTVWRDTGELFYRMECPCGYRIRDISSNELHPVLDQLSAGGMHSISIQRLLPILDRA